jgi:hypothetical protein
MPTYVITDPSTGKKIRLTGDSPPTEQELNQIFSQFSQQQAPEPVGVSEDIPTQESIEAEQIRASKVREQREQVTTGEQLLGLGEAALATATGATTGALGFGLGSIGGAVGELTGILEEGEGQKIAEQAAQSLTFEPKTKSGQEIVGAIGQAVGSLPAYLGTAPFNFAKVAAGAKTQKARRAVNIARDAIENPKETTTANVVNAIKKGSEQEFLDIAQVDPNFYRAADELGLNTEPLAAFASKNPQFRDVSGALQAVPGSVLDVQAKTFINELALKADDLIEQYGGSKDKALIGDNFKADALKTVDNLFEQADTAYSDFRKVLPSDTKITPQGTLDFISMKAMEFGGFDQLPPQLKAVFNRIAPKEKTIKGKVTQNVATGVRTDSTRTEVTPKTFAKVDQVRKEIGQAINKGTGPFKDAETGLNKALYAKLSGDFDDFASTVGGDVLSLDQAAKGLIKQRKQLEDNLTTLLGKDLNKALNVTVSGAIKNLSKGQTDKFREVIRAIPKSKRQEVVMTALNDVFKGVGVGQESLSPTQFTKWYQTINRSPQAKKMLFSVLPKESRQALDNLFEVSRGVSRALGQKVPTGRINALFNEDTGMIRKMVGRVAPSVVGFATGSPAASMASGVTMDFLNQSTNGAKKASDLIGSPAFQDMLRKAVKSGYVESKLLTDDLMKAEQRLVKTKQYKQWADFMADQGVVLTTGGIISYLLNDEEDK